MLSVALSTPEKEEVMMSILLMITMPVWKLNTNDCLRKSATLPPDWQLVRKLEVKTALNNGRGREAKISHGSTCGE